MIVRQPVEEGEVFGDVGAVSGDDGRVPGQVGARRRQPRQHRLPVAHRQRALREGVAQGLVSFSRASPLSRIADQGDDAGAHAVQIHDGMKGGADARPARHRRLQRGIEQEGAVVIDAHQHRFMAEVQRRDMDGALGALGGFGGQRQGQGRQLVGAGAQHIVGHRAGIERVEEISQRRILRQQRAGFLDAVRRVLGLFGLGGTDRGHHGHGRPLAKSAVI